MDEKRTALWHRVEPALGPLGLLAIVAGCIVVLIPFLSALLWAAILCYTTWTPYQWLCRRLRERRVLAAGLMTLLVGLCMVLPFAIVGFTFADNLAHLAQHAREWRENGIPPPPQSLPRCLRSPPD